MASAMQQDDNALIMDQIINNCMSEKSMFMQQLFDMQKTLFETKNSDPAKVWHADMLQKIMARMAKGCAKYSHGMRVDDDTRTYGTVDNSWLEMCEEEILDAIVYCAAYYIRESRKSV